MDPPDLQCPNSPEVDEHPPDAEAVEDGPGTDAEPPAMDWLAEIIHRLEEDPDECWPAIESLSAVDGEIRVQVVEALARHRDRPGVSMLLQLLGAMRDPSTRSAATRALTRCQAALGAETRAIAVAGPPDGASAG